MFHRDVAPGVHRIEDGYVNWFLVQDGNDLTAVDAGMTQSWPSLIAALDALGRSTSDVKALVLTHAHFDHVGIAERMRTELHVPVYVHAADTPLTAHPLRYDHEASILRYAWKPKTLGVLASFTAWGMWSTPAIGSVRTFNEEITLDVPGAPRVVFTPGHTYGHCALHLPERDVVIAGDAIVATEPYTQRPGPRIVCRAATADVEQNRRSLDRLADLSAGVALTGHGPPIFGGIKAAVVTAKATPVP
jgi:glyoxylase-like metal-dependent hydrolase (beta-lactamase superfamily II)